jgi:hypothetical protein
MKPRSNPLPTANPEIEEAYQEIKAVLVRLRGRMERILSTKERRRAIKVRRGGHDLIPQVLDIARMKPGLVPPGLDIDDLKQELADLKAMEQLSLLVGGFSTLLEDTMRLKRQDLWSATLRIYGIAKHWETDDGAVRALVAKMKTTLATGPRPRKDKGEPPAARAKKEKKS